MLCFEATGHVQNSPNNIVKDSSLIIMAFIQMNEG